MSTSMVSDVAYDSMNFLLILTKGTKLCLLHFIISLTGHQLHQEVFIFDGPLQAIFLVCHTAGASVCAVRLGKVGS